MALPLIFAGASLLLSAGGLAASLFGGSEDNSLEQAKINYYFQSQLMEAQKVQRRAEVEAQLSYSEKFLKKELDFALSSAAMEAAVEAMGPSPSYATIEAGKVRATEKRNETIRAIHSMAATYGASGVKVEGSPMDVMIAAGVQGEKAAMDIERISYMEATEDRGAAKRAAAAQAGLSIATARANLLYSKQTSALDLTRADLARTEAFEEEWAKKGKIYGYYAMQQTLGAYSSAKTSSILTQGSSFLSNLNSAIPIFSQVLSSNPINITYPSGEY